MASWETSCSCAGPRASSRHCALDLAEPLGRALAEIQRTLAFTQGFAPRTSATTFILALSEHPTFMVLPDLVERLRAEAPAVTLGIRNLTARDDATALLDAGEADLAVGVPPAGGGRVLTRPALEDRFVCILRQGHPTTRATLDLKAVLSLSHVLVSPENDRFGHVDVALSKLGLKRRFGLTLPQMYAAPCWWRART